MKPGQMCVVVPDVCSYERHGSLPGSADFFTLTRNTFVIFLYAERQFETQLLHDTRCVFLTPMGLINLYVPWGESEALHYHFSPVSADR